jgi:hypothetical protein
MLIDNISASIYNEELKKNNSSLLDVNNTIYNIE